jgi:hypothetical protein
MRRALFLIPAIVAGCLMAPAPAATALTTMEARAAARAEAIAAIQQAAEALKQQAEENVKPLAEGEIKVLKAVIMETRGRAQWRPDAKAKWKKAAVRDVLEPGAMIRTGRKSLVAMRIGHNASILVDRSSRVTLPEIVHAGETLKTTVQIKRGRADFKVDRVGLTNDFSVVTPSTTLAVRGTSMGVDYGGFNGTKITAARTNALRSIEVTFLLNQASFFMSGSSTSSDENQNPVESGADAAEGPTDTASEGTGDPAASDPTTNQRNVDTSVQTTMAVEELPIFDEPDEPDEPDFPDFPGNSFAEAAEFICNPDYIFSIFSVYDDNLFDSFPPDGDGKGGFNFPGLDQLYLDVDDYCQAQEGIFEDEDLIAIVSLVQAFCEDHFSAQEDIDLCVSDFVDAVNTTYDSLHGP